MHISITIGASEKKATTARTVADYKPSLLDKAKAKAKAAKEAARTGTIAVLDKAIDKLEK